MSTRHTHTVCGKRLQLRTKKSSDATGQEAAGISTFRRRGFLQGESAHPSTSGGRGEGGGWLQQRRLYDVMCEGADLGGPRRHQDVPGTARSSTHVSFVLNNLSFPPLRRPLDLSADRFTWNRMRSDRARSFGLAHLR